MSTSNLSRRRFLKTLTQVGAAAAAAPMVVPRRVLGGPNHLSPSDTLNIAGIGIGGMGKVNIANLASQNIVALCDVDWGFAAPVFDKYPDAKRYKDYRRMFDEMGDEIDGVVVATPDHTHAVISMEAMNRGINVYTQKPLTWSVWEARQLKKAAQRTGVVTQMGNQHHSENKVRQVVEHLRAGTIGQVREVHVWTNRPIWPQGQAMPEVLERKPNTLAWDLFLGPAQKTAYDSAFHPFSWRGWVPFGTGALGDIAPHSIDYPYWALELDAPTTVETRSTAFNGASYPAATTTRFNFPARGSRPPVTIVWYDGGLMPPRPEELPDDEALSPDGGLLYVGSEGKLIQSDGLRFLPNALDKNRPNVPQSLERIPDESHEMNWVRAIRGEARPSSPFSYAAALTEALLLGVVSMRAGNRQIKWDAKNMRVTNLPEANKYLRREPRKGWALQT